MTRCAYTILIPIGILMLAVSSVQASWDNWNCNLRVYWGAVDGSPAATGDYFGVQPGATDGYDRIDCKKPGMPMGNHVDAWFEHPTWVDDLGYLVGPLIHDWRAPIPEGTRKQWGRADPVPVFPPTDYWAVHTNYNAADTGCMDPCWQYFEYPIAASVYISWEFGVTGLPKDWLPPDDYTFTIKYMGGIYPKPADCILPGVTVPAVDTTWDMEVTPHIVVPIWSFNFLYPYNYPACDGTTALPDRAKFFLIVSNPDTMPTCTIEVDPPGPQEAPATFAFTATAAGDVPFMYSWDFGDGASDTGNPVSHTYTTAGTHTVTCTVTDANGDTSTCEATVEVIPETVCFSLTGNCRNMITLPGQPVNPDPWEVFDELRPPNKPFDLLTGNLHRYDQELQGYVTYYRWAPSQFGPLTPCEGYWLWSFYDETICYDAVLSSAAEARSLPTIGWYIVGSPHTADLYIDDTLWYRGADGPHPFSEIMNIWVQDPLVFWSCATGSYRTCGLLPIDNDHYLRAFQGYWLYTFVDDLTMEVPRP